MSIPTLRPDADRHPDDTGPSGTVDFGTAVDVPTRTLTVQGELDFAARPHLYWAGAVRLGAGPADGPAQAGLDRDASVASGEPARALCDLHGVTFLDASGLGALVDLHHTFAAAGVRLEVVNVPKTLRRLFHWFDLDDLLSPLL